jgi:hypothetical protein
MPYRNDDTGGGPSARGPQPPPSRYGAAGALGSREHVCETLQRARAPGTVGRPASLARGAQDALALRAQLRASVSAYVRHLRDGGVPSERMVIDVKAAVREATPPELDAYEARDLMEDVVRWSVEAYYHVG